jgi:hypothetical protein
MNIQFMKELREENTTTGSLSRVVKYMRLDQRSSSSSILENIDEKLEAIKQNSLTDSNTTQK